MEEVGGLAGTVVADEVVLQGLLVPGGVHGLLLAHPLQEVDAEPPVKHPPDHQARRVLDRLPAEPLFEAVGVGAPPDERRASPDQSEGALFNEGHLVPL